MDAKAKSISSRIRVLVFFLIVSCCANFVPHAIESKSFAYKIETKVTLKYTSSSVNKHTDAKL